MKHSSMNSLPAVIAAMLCAVILLPFIYRFWVVLVIDEQGAISVQNLSGSSTEKINSRDQTSRSWPDEMSHVGDERSLASVMAPPTDAEINRAIEEENAAKEKLAKALQEQSTKAKKIRAEIDKAISENSLSTEAPITRTPKKKEQPSAELLEKVRSKIYLAH